MELPFNAVTLFILMAYTQSKTQVKWLVVQDVITLGNTYVFRLLRQLMTVNKT